MATVEAITFWSAVALYAIAVVVSVVALASGGVRAANWAHRIALTAFVLHTASILVRLVASGRLPVAEDYENALAGAWMIAFVYLAVAHFKPTMRVLGALVLPIVLLSLGFGATSPAAVMPLTPAYRSGWLSTHVSFAWISYACYSCVAALGVAVLIRARGRRLPARVEALLPSPDEIDDVSTRLAGIGFLANAVMLTTGAIWGYRLWGSYWSWDPVETWTLITWLVFGLYLHLKLTMGWSGPRLAWVAILGLFGTLMAFWGVQLAPSTFHLFREMGAGRPGG